MEFDFNTNQKNGKVWWFCYRFRAIITGTG